MENEKRIIKALEKAYENRNRYQNTVLALANAGLFHTTDGVRAAYYASFYEGYDMALRAVLHGFGDI